MDWIERLLSRKQRGKMTVAQIAESLGWVIGQSVNDLIKNLESLGVARDYPDRFNSVAFLIECLIFEAFQMDVITFREFGPHSEAIRAKLYGYAFQIAQDAIGVDPGYRSQFEQLQDARFVEYTEALKAGAADQAWGEKLASLAAKRIFPGTESFSVISCLTIDVASRFKHFRGMGSWAEIVEGPR